MSKLKTSEYQRSKALSKESIDQQLTLNEKIVLDSNRQQLHNLVTVNQNQSSVSSSSFSGSNNHFKIISSAVDKNSNSSFSKQKISESVEEEKETESKIQETQNQIGKLNKKSIGDKKSKKVAEDKIEKPPELKANSTFSFLNRGNSVSSGTTTIGIFSIDSYKEKNKQQSDHHPLKTTQSVPTNKISSSGIFQRFKSSKSKSVSISTTSIISDHRSPVFSTSNSVSYSSTSSNQLSPSKNNNLNNQEFATLNSAPSSATNSSNFDSTQNRQIISSNSTTATQQSQEEQCNSKKTKKRRSFELFNTGKIIRRQHSAHQSSQSSPGPTINSTGEQRKESISSTNKATQQLPLSVVISTELNSSVTNQGVGGGVNQTTRVNQPITQLDPSNVASSGGSTSSTPANASSSSGFAGVASTVNFARRFLLNRSKTSGLLFSGPSSLADQNRPHSRTVQEIFRGEMSVRRPRGSFRNSLHRFGSAETTRRPIRHHAWAFKNGEWYIAYGE